MFGRSKKFMLTKGTFGQKLAVSSFYLPLLS